MKLFLVALIIVIGNNPQHTFSMLNLRWHSGGRANWTRIEYTKTLIFDWLPSSTRTLHTGTISSGESTPMPHHPDRDQIPSEYTEYSCPRRCKEDYYPICGTNKSGESKVFVNDCYMALENCNQSPQRGTVFFLSSHSHLSIVLGWWAGGHAYRIGLFCSAKFTFSHFVFLVWHRADVHLQYSNRATDRNVPTTAIGYQTNDTIHYRRVLERWAPSKLSYF